MLSISTSIKQILFTLMPLVVYVIKTRLGSCQTLITQLKATLLLHDSCAPRVIPDYYWRCVQTVQHREQLYLP